MRIVTHKCGSPGMNIIPSYISIVSLCLKRSFSELSLGVGLIMCCIVVSIATVVTQNVIVLYLVHEI